MSPVLTTVSAATLAAGPVWAATAAFGEPTGQSWSQVAELAVAFGLSLLIGLEREMQQKSAGVRTYTVVGLGSALFVLISKYGFTDVIGPGVTLDPSRVAAQIVSGLGFIGGGLIFVRRDAVRGLTTAASVWLTAAVAAAAGAGLTLLAAVTTAMYFVLLYGVRPLLRRVPRLRPDAMWLRVTYLDGHGALQRILDVAIAQGFVISDVTTRRVEAAGEGGRGREDQHDHEIAAADVAPSTIDVTLVLHGRADRAQLASRLSEVDAVLAVRTGPPDPDE